MFSAWLFIARRQPPESPSYVLSLCCVPHTFLAFSKFLEVSGRILYGLSPWAKDKGKDWKSGKKEFWREKEKQVMIRDSW